MPEQHNTLGADTDASADQARKPWRTPHVIVSALRDSEAKGPPTAELSLIASPSSHTGS